MRSPKFTYFLNHSPLQPLKALNGTPEWRLIIYRLHIPYAYGKGPLLHLWSHDRNRGIQRTLLLFRQSRFWHDWCNHTHSIAANWIRSKVQDVRLRYRSAKLPTWSPPKYGRPRPCRHSSAIQTRSYPGSSVAASYPSSGLYLGTEIVNHVRHASAGEIQYKNAGAEHCQSNSRLQSALTRVPSEWDLQIWYLLTLWLPEDLLHFISRFTELWETMPDTAALSVKKALYQRSSLLAKVPDHAN